MGILVALSTVLQGLQNADERGIWRPYVLIGGVVAGLIAAWQLVANAVLNRTETPADPHALTGDDPRKVGPYRILARLGSGAMGRAYLGKGPGGYVAVKVIRPEYADSTEFRRRFAREVTAIDAVANPYTTSLLAADPQAEQPWLATTYVPGPSLQQAVEEHGPWPADRVWRLASGVAQALAAIHAAHVVHRDLKPSNILLDATGPRVIDFGIARAIDASHLTATVNRPGTPAFMAPEQVVGGQIGPKADVFALGGVLVFATAGRAAFGDGTSDAVLYRILHEQPDLSGLDPQLRDLVAACLDKEPAARPDPAEIIRRCAAHLATRPPAPFLPETVTAVPDLTSAERRPRRLVAVVAVLALFVALASVGWQIFGAQPGSTGEPGALPTSAGPSTTSTPEASASPQATATPDPTLTATPGPDGGGQVSLRIKVSGPAGSGKVTGGGLSCPPACSASFAAGSAVTLAAVNGEYYAFDGWQGCTGRDSCTVTLDKARTVTAKFHDLGATIPCTAYDPGNLTVADNNGQGWLLMSGSTLVHEMDGPSDNVVEPLARAYASHCLLKSGDFIEYWKGGSGLSGSISGSTCQTYGAAGVTLASTGGMWRIQGGPTFGRSPHALSFTRQDTAIAAWRFIKSKSRLCMSHTDVAGPDTFIAQYWF